MLHALTVFRASPEQPWVEALYRSSDGTLESWMRHEADPTLAFHVPA
jgi:hypothetical protein